MQIKSFISHKIILSFLLGLQIGPLFAHATEVDQFSQRSKRIGDIGPRIDSYINTKLQLASAKLKNCDQDSLYKNVFNELGEGNTYPKIDTEVSEIIAKESLPKKVFNKVEKSVYDKVPFTIVGVGNRCGICVDSINAHGFEIGIDKLGHFFSEGYDYFYLTHLKPKNQGKDFGNFLKKLDELKLKKQDDLQFKGNENDFIFKLGDSQEKGTWGMRYNHIYSYGDLVANYEGFQFWKSLISGSSPYFKCVDNTWKQVRVFTLKDYLSHGFDESINCSSFSKEADKDVQKDIQNILSKQKMAVTKCPVYPSLCRSIVEKYQESSEFLVHPECIKASQNSGGPRLKMLPEGVK